MEYICITTVHLIYPSKAGLERLQWIDGIFGGHRRRHLGNKITPSVFIERQ